LSTTVLLVSCLDEVKVTRKYQITIPKKIREKLGIKIGDRLLIDVIDDKIIMIPIRPRDALKKLASIADRILGGPKRIDAVKLIEGSLEREMGIS